MPTHESHLGKGAAAEMIRSYNEGTAAIQIDVQTVVIDHAGTDQLLSISTTLPVLGISCDARHVVIWGENQINVYGIVVSHTALVSELQLGNVKSVSLAKDSLFIVNDNQLRFMSLMGEHKCTVDFSSEGRPTCMSSVNMNDNLVVITEQGYLKVIDMNGADAPKPHPSISLHQLAPGIGDIISVECNATASLISLVTTHECAAKLFVFNTLRQEFKLVHSEYLGTVITHCWDPAEPRLLACDFCTHSISKLADSSSQTLLFFIDEEGGGIYQQEMITHSHSCHLIGLDVPYIVFSDQDGKVSNQVLSDFVGLEDESPLALAAILDFSFYSRLGEIDKSFESLQAIKSPRVWSHIVPICIKMKRLDLTEICLSHTTSPEGLAAVELAKKEPEVEVALAAAAVQFGFYNIAKDLYTECQRYDLVNQLLQMLGEWDAAIQVAEVDDVIHSDLTRYQYARYLEENERQFDKAAVGKYAKKSVKFQALVRERRLDELECFVSQHNDKELYSWFGQFNQSLGNIDKAFEYFSLAGDDVKLVELHCSEGNFNEAHRIVDEGGNAAAAYYLSKFFSGSDAIKLLSAGGMFNHAIRLAITENLDSELLDLASKSISPEQASSCAQYFEKKGLAVDACRLFARSGETAKALAICLTLLDHNEEDDKETIDLFVSLVKKSSGEIPSELSQQVYHWLQQAGEADLIVDVICSKTKDPHECLHFFSNHDIQLSEAIVTKLLSLCADEESNDILQGIAMACSEQGSFKLACDLYTRCGEETKAIKCLFNAGDAEALSALANESKSTSVYALAANYLQKMPADDSVQRSIIQLYNKAEKFDRLVTYLISQSQTCVKQYGDYEKAMQYLKEASAISVKLNASATKEIKKLISERVSTMEWFVYAQESFHTMDRLSLENLCLDLLSPQSNQIIREADCYALLVNYFFASDQHQTAYTYLQKMQECGNDPCEFLEKSMVKTILQSVGNEDSLSDDE